nr:Xylulose kinase [Candidatus Pantoea persica]
MYIGIDLGTSGVKVALLDAQGEVAAVTSAPLQVSRPRARWSEQDPESWWRATDQAMQALAQQPPLGEVKAIGLSGQMHGATLLDGAHRVLRLAIL